MANRQIFQLTAEASLDSMFVIPVQKADGSEEAKKVTIESLKAPLGIDFKVYSALITQSGTGVPTLKQLQNTTGATFTTSFLSTGTFTLNASSNIVTPNKTATINSFNSYGEFPDGRIDFYIDGANSFLIETRNSGTLANDIITDAFIEIRIYS
jgi:hypothetical protein